MKTSVKDGINKSSDEYKLSIELLKSKTSELEIRIKETEYDLKSKMQGIAINYFELSELNIEANIEEEKPENEECLKRLDSVLNKIKENKKIIDNDYSKLEFTENGDIAYKSNIGICKRCGNLLENDSKFCKICGAKILK